MRVICGPMFSGKTTRLIDLYDSLHAVWTPLYVLVPSIDTRSHGNLVSRSGRSIPAHVVEPGAVERHIGEGLIPNHATVLVDEAQFFSSSDLKALADRSSDTVVCGLDLWSNGAPTCIHQSQAWMQNSEFEMVTGTCSECGRPSTHTKKVVGAPTDIVEIGDHLYAPVCHVCFSKVKIQHESTFSTLIYGSDCRDSLDTLPDQSVQVVCTSPPYWGLRDYDVDPSVWGGDRDCSHEWGDVTPVDIERIRTSSNSGKQNYVADSSGFQRDKGKFCLKCGAWCGQLGSEPDPFLFVQHMVLVFQKVKRVLKDDGVLWVNMGDTYGNPGIKRSALSTTGGFTGSRIRDGKKGTMFSMKRDIPDGVKFKDLIGVPWMLAFALREDGWYLRQEIIWSKNNPLPESVTDRCTKAHEHIFLLSKSEQYFFNADRIKEPSITKSGEMRNKRSVWTTNLQPYKGAHFATWPEELVATMIKASTSDLEDSDRDVVLDPFSGSGTTGQMAKHLGCNYIGLDMNHKYLELAKSRICEEPLPAKEADNAFDCFLD